MSATEPLHKQCRTLESLFDNKLTAYSRLAATVTRPGSHDLESNGSLERWQDLEVELEELLQKVCATSAHSIWSLTCLGWL
jgi:Golgi SNAP receptor complex protein 1